MVSSLVVFIRLPSDLPRLTMVGPRGHLFPFVHCSVAKPAVHQDIVRFCLAGSPHVFWAAYPRPTEKDAKLMAVQDECEDVPREIRDRIRKHFMELSRFAPEKFQKIPTVSFEVLKHVPSFAKVI